MITVDLLMSTNPCVSWPRERVERLVSHLDCASWSAFVRSAQASRWCHVSIADLTLTVCRYAATHHHVTVLTPWVQHVTRARTAVQRRGYPQASAGVVAIWDRLNAWDGTKAQARAIYADADAADAGDAADDAAAAATAAYAYAAATAAATAACADAAAYATVCADTEAYAELLIGLCARLDAAMVRSMVRSEHTP